MSPGNGNVGKNHFKLNDLKNFTVLWFAIKYFCQLLGFQVVQVVCVLLAHLDIILVRLNFLTLKTLGTNTSTLAKISSTFSRKQYFGHY